MIRLAPVQLALIIVAALVMASPTLADDDAITDWDDLSWRSIGPWRGGRVAAVAGVPSQPFTYYFGASGGGVWRTDDGGTTWRNLSDGDFRTASIGAVSVAPSDPNVIWVGTGEGCFRGVASAMGDGVYRSTDGGESWRHLGLEASQQIPAIRVHPDDPDVAWVAAQGHPFMPNEERGVFRTRDGGASWQHVLAIDASAGASDLALDASNPRILYAAVWQHRRRPWTISSGGAHSGIWKSVDGGDSWTRLGEGLPQLMGKIGVAVSPADAGRVWAIVEAEGDAGGLYRSDDRGESWRQVNGERRLHARAWYYQHVIAHPTDQDTVYVLNAAMLRSVDGGRNFERIRTPHGDNHSLWIHPDNPLWMVQGNDGGANVSFNGGVSWTRQDNQPTAQIYRVAVDRQTPYRVYGGQQDNSTLSIPSRSPAGSIGREDWFPVGGCESGHIAFDPDDPSTVYAGCYQGQISAWDRELRHDRSIKVYESIDLGVDPVDAPYRFNWNAPIVVSPHDPGVVYHAAQMILRTDDGGRSWRAISPDLTRDDPDRQGPGGRPITDEAAGGEVYGTILVVVESPHAAGTIWAGSDDGRVHVTRDGGGSWNDVTPPAMPEGMVNSIEVSPHHEDTVLLAHCRYKFGDTAPYIWRTDDDGASWRRIDRGLPAEAFVRVVREDPMRPGLLYAGTERGVFVSFDGGGAWTSLQLDLPPVPVTDLTAAEDDLVAATEGRGFWILDDLAPLRQVGATADGPRLLRPAAAVRWLDGANSRSRPGRGDNPPYGAVIDWVMDEVPDGDDMLVLEVLDSKGRVLRRWESLGDGDGDGDGDGEGDLDGDGAGDGDRDDDEHLPFETGHTRWVWDLRTEELPQLDGISFWLGRSGPRVYTGSYVVRLRIGDELLEQPLEIVDDPRTELDSADVEAYQAFIADLEAANRSVHRMVIGLRTTRAQLDERLARLEDRDLGTELDGAASALSQAVGALEADLYQPRQEAYLDEINFPNRLRERLLELLSIVDGSGPPVTQGMRERWRDLASELEQHEARYAVLLGRELASFDQAWVDAGFGAIVLPEAE